MGEKITKTQSERLEKITALIERSHPVIVTLSDIRAELGLESEQAAHHTVQTLIRAGYLERKDGALKSKENENE